MSGAQATLTLAPALLVQARGLALNPPIQMEGQRVAQDRIVSSIDRGALEARRARLVLSNSAIDPPRLAGLFLVAATMLDAGLAKLTGREERRSPWRSSPRPGPPP